MTADAPKCLSCKNYIGSKLCAEYGDCPDNVFANGENCEKYEKGETNAH